MVVSKRPVWLMLQRLRTAMFIATTNGLPGLEIFHLQSWKTMSYVNTLLAPSKFIFKSEGSTKWWSPSYLLRKVTPDHMSSTGNRQWEAALMPVRVEMPPVPQSNIPCWCIFRTSCGLGGRFDGKILGYVFPWCSTPCSWCLLCFWRPFVSSHFLNQTYPQTIDPCLRVDWPMPQVGSSYGSTQLDSWRISRDALHGMV